jgi:cold shock CspA family protein
MFEGTICKVRVDKGYGFISAPSQPDAFFHCRDLVPELPFDETLQERRVRFEIIGTERGPRAKNVKPAAD